MTIIKIQVFFILFLRRLLYSHLIFILLSNIDSKFLFHIDKGSFFSWLLCIFLDSVVYLMLLFKKKSYIIKLIVLAKSSWVNDSCLNYFVFTYLKTLISSQHSFYSEKKWVQTTDLVYRYTSSRQSFFYLKTTNV